ncbi:MAG TPA: type II toxin-antitoxin system VapC family toxin [Ktedonobacteraceae bacterium]|nr:type II toxin-antitoxin system VapC family toxin [Ktedonobacteraceae bacterium]HXZ04917.1 type II toxin-antitoxin system VapC family toxin [Ktedonobacteraceae bacterium]
MDGSVVIDASVLVSWIVSGDTNHNDSYFWMKKYRAVGGLLIVPAFAMIEIAAALTRQSKQPALAKATIKDLYSLSILRIVPLDPPLVRVGVDIASDFQLRAGESTYVAVAYTLKIPLVSWDKEQLQRGGNLIATYTPVTYPFELPEQS